MWIRNSSSSSPGDADITKTRSASTTASRGWLARVSLRLPGGETLVAHVPNEGLHGAREGDRVRVDLRNPKAFFAPEHVLEPEEIVTGA